MSSHTIFALATPPGKSGVAVLRISGKGALPALQQLTGRHDWMPNKLTYSALGTYNSQLIDRGMAIYFKAPQSFTGEDVVELQVHGSLAVIRELLGVLGGLDGLRPAERGEFTRRALLNGKMDLVEAEGLADLIDAETTEQRHQALRQMQGDMSGFYERLRTEIIATLAHLEATIDFPDEDIPESVFAGLEAEVRAVIATISTTLAQHAAGERIREGISIVILGAPNSGKSSLLNALSKREAAIVSHHAGTTRDMIEVHLEIAGYPVILVDTAGLRETQDDIETEGIRRAVHRAAHADLRLVLFDGTQPPDTASRALLGEGAIAVITKSDLPQRHSLPGAIALSATTGEGVETLLALIESRIVSGFSGEGAMITRARHRALLMEAMRHLERFFTVPEVELKCEELRIAAHSIGKITGKIAIDDVLDVVFREFCIGK